MLMEEEILMKEKHEDDDDLMADRFSQLPEHIIHHIMSFLPTPTDTTRISFLSKYFNSVWHTFPVLTFNRTLVFPINLGRRCKFSEFANFILKSLARYTSSTPLQKFSFESPLYLCDDKIESDGRIDYMLDFALQSKVEELKLDFGRHFQAVKNMYRFPEAIFSAKQITSLDLRGLRLEPPHITLSCPSIENFRLQDCYGFTSISLRGTSLKMVALLHCPDLKKFHIEAPTSVEHVSFDGPNVIRTSYQGLKDKCEMNIASCYKSIKVLDLMNQWIDEEWLETNSCVLHNVEKLILTQCNVEWSNARLYLDKLKSVVLTDCWKIVADEFEAPNLVSFECWSFESRIVAEPCRRPFSISSTSSLLNVRLFFQYLHYLIEDYPAYKDLEFFIRPFSNFQTLTLACGTYKELVIPTHVLRKESDPPLLHAVKYLNIELEEEIPKMGTVDSGDRLVDSLFVFGPHPNISSITTYINRPIVDLVDSLLWFAPRPNIISITTYNRPLIRSIKFTCDDEDDEPVSGPVKFRRGNNFKEVILENFDDEDNTFLEKYFSETCKIVRFVKNITATNHPKKNYGLNEQSPRCLLHL